MLTRTVAIKTRCTQGYATLRRVIEAGSPQHDAMLEKNLQQ